VRWAWPFKVDVRNDRHREKNRSVPGDPGPDFLCIGAQKGGTSWLYYQLAFHPDFWMPPIKELHYFDQLNRSQHMAFPRPRDGRDLRFVESINSLSAETHMDLENYARLFELKKSLLCGDITPAYSTLNDEMIARVVGYFPNAKVIFLARDPVERAWSQLSMEVRLRMISPFDVSDIHEVIQNLLRPGVVLRSHPSKTVAQWKRHVRADLFRIYFFDDLERNPAELRRSILDFLGSDPDKPSGRLRADYNSDVRKKKLPLTDKVRACVAGFFEDELRACATELAGQPEIGRRDMVFHCCFSSGS
jgi:hypothetical protein